MMIERTCPSSVVTRGRPSPRPRPAFLGVVLALLAVSASCSPTRLVAHAALSATGNTGDVACDRRFVHGGAAAGFCQEVVGTVAVSAIRDDCLDKHKAKAFRGLCPDEKKIAGCKLSLLTEDGSEVYDWYYDVGDLEREAETSFESRVRSIGEVRQKCADPTRYEEGAELVLPRGGRASRGRTAERLPSVHSGS